MLGDQPAPPSGQLRPITYKVDDYGVPPASELNLLADVYDMPYALNDTICRPQLVFYVFIYVISAVVILECLHQLYQRLHRRMINRTLLFSVFMSIIVLAVYDVVYSSGSGIGLLGSHVYITDIIAWAVLLWGIFIYNKDEEPDETFLTEAELSIQPKFQQLF